MAITYGEMKEGSARRIAGVCVDSSEFRQHLNDATRRLMRRGDWKGTVVPIQVCARAGCVVFPRYVGQVRKINVCGEPLPTHSMWWRFLAEGRESLCAGDCQFLQEGTLPTFDTVQGDYRNIRFYPKARADIGKVVRVFGVDNNGQILRTRDATGAWYEGQDVTLAAPFGSTSDFVRSVDRILLPSDLTHTLSAYAYNAVDDVLEPLGFYEPGDARSPEFVRYTLRIPAAEYRSVRALVKLKFLPVRTDYDLVLIDNEDAIKLMIQSIKAEEAGDREMARSYEMDAIRELNLDLADDQPEGYVPVVSEPFNTVPIGTQRLY